MTFVKKTLTGACSLILIALACLTASVLTDESSNARVAASRQGSSNALEIDPNLSEGGRCGDCPRDSNRSGEASRVAIDLPVDARSLLEPVGEPLERSGVPEAARLKLETFAQPDSLSPFVEAGWAFDEWETGVPSAQTAGLETESPWKGDFVPGGFQGGFGGASPDEALRFVFGARGGPGFCSSSFVTASSRAEVVASAVEIPNDPTESATPTPEPATILLVGTGLTLLAGMIRKKGNG
jgi:hypothetical protein